MFEMKNITAGYGEVNVLKNVGFQVPQGQIIALVGSNGAGKTTITRVISKSLKPSSGSIIFDGQDYTGKQPHEVVEMGIVQVPEGRRLFPDMTIYENLLVGSTCRHAKAQREQSLKEVFETFPRLEERKDQKAKTLSGGEQQMLAIGRALMARPKMLILDEPSLGLSPLMVQQVFSVVRGIKERGMTILLIEQNVKLSLSICNYAYVLENGRIVLQGTGEELMDNEHLRKAYLGI